MFKIGDRVSLEGNDGTVVMVLPEMDSGLTDFQNKLFEIVHNGPSLIISWDNRALNREHFRPLSVDYFKHIEEV